MMRRRDPQEMLYDSLEQLQLLTQDEVWPIIEKWGGHIAELLKLIDKPCVCPVCSREVDDHHLYLYGTRPWWYGDPSQADGPPPPPHHHHHYHSRHRAAVVAVPMEEGSRHGGGGETAAPEAGAYLHWFAIGHLHRSRQGAVSAIGHLL